MLRLLKALVHMILWFNYNGMDVVNVVFFYLVIIFEVINEFFYGDNTDSLH